MSEEEAPKEQTADRLSDEQVAAKAREIWPEVGGWAERASQLWLPAPGSSLAQDDAQAQTMTTSHVARVSLIIGSEHMSTMLTHSFNFGPSLFSMQTLLRTAMVGGAQAVWLLSPEDRTTRLDRTNRLCRDAFWNQSKWAETVATQDPAVVDPIELSALRGSLAKITDGRGRPEVQMKSVVQTAVEYSFSKPPDPSVWAHCIAEFQNLSGVAHALPWVLHTRTDVETVDFAGETATVHHPSWTQLQAAISFSYAFLRKGWGLLERQGDSV